MTTSNFIHYRDEDSWLERKSYYGLSIVTPAQFPSIYSLADEGWYKFLKPMTLKLFVSLLSLS